MKTATNVNCISDFTYLRIEEYIKVDCRRKKSIIFDIPLAYNKTESIVLQVLTS
jgi:hypothetical protein